MGEIVMSHETAFPRSFLYVPGDQPSLFPKAANSAADGIILDLEDAVTTSAKEYALEQVTAWLSNSPAAKRWWVRVDPAHLADQLEAVAMTGVHGIFLAKVGEASLAEANTILSRLEKSRPAIPVIGLIESASTLTSLEQLAHHPRLLTFGMGEVDLLADLGMVATSRTAEVINTLRARVVIACAAAGLQPPVAPTSTNFRDQDAFMSSSQLFSELGFGARTAIHPSQASIINQAFTPTDQEIAEAADLLARLKASDIGVAVDENGNLIDAAVIRRAERILSRASGH